MGTAEIRSQQPSCLPPGAGHIPLSQTLPSSPLSMGCPKKAPSAASALHNGHRVIPHPAGYSQVSNAPLHLKDQAVQTEVTSCSAAHSDFDTSNDIPQDSRELLKQVSAGSPPATTPSLGARGAQPGGTGAMTTTLQGSSPLPFPQKPWDRVGGNNANLSPPPHTARHQAALSIVQPTEGSCACAQGRAHSTRPTPQLIAFSAAGGTGAESRPALQPSLAAGAAGSHPGPGATEPATAEQNQ